MKSVLATIYIPHQLGTTVAASILTQVAEIDTPACWVIRIKVLGAFKKFTAALYVWGLLKSLSDDEI